FAPTHEVVRIRKDAVPAAGDATFPAVAAKDRTPDCGRNGLRRTGRQCAHVGASVDASGGASVCIVPCAHVGARVGVVVHAHACVGVGLSARVCVGVVVDAHVCVHVSNVLPVAFRHFDDFGTHVDEL